MYFLIFLVVSLLALWIFLHQPQFGKSPSREQLSRIQQSKHYHNGQFHNLEKTPSLTEGYNMGSVLCDFLFKNHPRTKPRHQIPNIKTHLNDLPISTDLYAWFGHSSYFLQLGGQRFLIDPVFSGNASPIPHSNRSFTGSDAFTVDDLPEIDYLLITHDHYDHLDYKTIKQLKEKVRKVICGLGVGAHFEHWGYENNQIIELDWDEKCKLANDIQLTTTTARHFSGRSLKRNATLWLSYILETDQIKIFLGGDSGWGTHFQKIGEKYGPFDIGILENGQYDAKWRYIHLLPEELIRTASDLGLKRVIPVHHSKFKLANHPWDEPMRKAVELSQHANFELLTPKIGEVVYFNRTSQKFDRWWEGLE